MNKILRVFIFVLSFTWSIDDLMAQCSQVVFTTTPTINNGWDWRLPTWPIYAQPTINPGVNGAAQSPFFSGDVNVSALSIRPQQELDFKPEDGWEVVKKELGSSQIPNNKLSVPRS